MAPYIHEILHAFSVGCTDASYARAGGWEEGCVEGLQRMLRPMVLERLGITLATPSIEAEEKNHLYSFYVQALNVLCIRSNADRMEFYLKLLSTPHPQRSDQTWATMVELRGRKERGLFENMDAQLRIVPPIWSRKD